MGKSNKPAKWFNAVKKAFRSPSKEKHSHRHSKAVTDEKLGPASSCNICTSSTTHAGPTPLPLPSFETINFNEAEHGDTQKQPLPIPEAISLADSVQSLNEEEHMEEEIRGYNDEEEEEEDVVEEEELEKKKNHNHEEEIRRDDVIEVDDEAFLDKQDKLQEEEIVANGVESAHGEDNHRINYVSEEDEEESEAAVTRIQQRFEGPLALGGLIRLQALVRGHRVRRQAATTLRAMQALVRVQAHVRGHQFRRSKEGQAIQESIKLHRQLRSSRPSFKAGDGHWDTSRGSVEDRDAERSRWEIGARKTERAKAYAFSQQLKKNNTQSKNSLYINCEPDQPHWGWTWLERWTYARPWELTQQQQQQQSANSRKDYNYYDIVPTSMQKNLGYTTGKKEELDASTWKESYFGTSSPVTSPHDINTPTKATTKSIFNSPRALSLNSSPRAVLDKRDSGNFSMSPVGTTTTNNSGNFPSSPVGSRAKSISPRAINISISPRALSQSPRKDSHFNVSHFEQHHHPLPLPLPLPVPVESAAGDNNVLTSPKSGNNNFSLIKPSPIEVPAQYPAWDEEEETQEKVIQDEHEEPAAKTVFESPEDLPNSAVKPASEKLSSSNFSVASSSPAHSSDSSLPLAPPSPQGSDTSLPVPETPPERFLSEDHDLSNTMDHLMLPESATSRKPRKSPAANGVLHRHIKVDSPTTHKQSASDSTSVHTSNGHREHRNGDRAAGEFNGDNTSPLPTGMMTMKPAKARYMAPTESAKAKYRSSSNPKTRSANLVESPTGKQPKRYSLGGQQAKIDHSPRTDHSPKTALNTQHQQRNSTFQTRGVLSPKVAQLKEKSPDIGAVDSPARRNSLGGTAAADGKYGRWRT